MGDCGPDQRVACFRYSQPTVRTAADVAGKAVAGAASSANNPLDSILDAMLRHSAGASAANREPSGTPAGAPQSPSAVASTPDDTRGEVSRILASAVGSGSLSAENRAYLANLVAQRSGVPQQQAEKRADDAITAARTAADKDQTRGGSIWLRHGGRADTFSRCRLVGRNQRRRTPGQFDPSSISI